MAVCVLFSAFCLSASADVQLDAPMAVFSYDSANQLLTVTVGQEQVGMVTSYSIDYYYNNVSQGNIACTPGNLTLQPPQGTSFAVGDVVRLVISMTPASGYTAAAETTVEYTLSETADNISMEDVVVTEAPIHKKSFCYTLSCSVSDAYYTTADTSKLKAMGLSLSTTGVISGTARYSSGSGSTTITVTVRRSQYASVSATATVTIPAVVQNSDYSLTAIPADMFLGESIDPLDFLASDGIAGKWSFSIAGKPEWMDAAISSNCLDTKYTGGAAASSDVVLTCTFKPTDCGYEQKSTALSVHVNNVLSGSYMSSIKKVWFEENSVKVKIAADSLGGKLFVAGYDTNGKMISAGFVSVTGSTSDQTLTAAFRDLKKMTSIKVFMLSVAFLPQSDS